MMASGNLKEVVVFDIKLHLLKKSEFIELIQSYLENGNQIVQNGINAASVNLIKEDSILRDAINNSDLINIDGMSVVWALRFLGYHVPERVACPDLANDILALAEKNHYRLFLLGAKDSSLILCQDNLKKTYPDLIIAGYRNGYYNEEDEKGIVDLINSANTDILFLGMPSPKKELFIEKYRNDLRVKYFFGVGGLFDIISGLKKRAPKWIQNIGMEWFYRLIQEPGRMWKRYFVGNIAFIKLVFSERRKRSQKNTVKQN